MNYAVIGSISGVEVLLPKGKNTDYALTDKIYIIKKDSGVYIELISIDSIMNSTLTTDGYIRLVAKLEPYNSNTETHINTLKIIRRTTTEEEFIGNFSVMMLNSSEQINGEGASGKTALAKTITLDNANSHTCVFLFPDLLLSDLAGATFRCVVNRKILDDVLLNQYDSADGLILNATVPSNIGLNKLEYRAYYSLNDDISDNYYDLMGSAVYRLVDINSVIYV